MTRNIHWNKFDCIHKPAAFVSDNCFGLLNRIWIVYIRNSLFSLSFHWLICLDLACVEPHILDCELNSWSNFNIVVCDLFVGGGHFHYFIRDQIVYSLCRRIYSESEWEVDALKSSHQFWLTIRHLEALISNLLLYFPRSIICRMVVLLQNINRMGVARTKWNVQSERNGAHVRNNRMKSKWITKLKINKALRWM